MKNKEITELKKLYMDHAIPDELDFIVKRALKKGRRRNMIKEFKGIVAVAVLVIIIFVGGVNISPTIANALEEVPILNNLVHVLTFREYRVNKETFKANLKVPAIDGMENHTLQSSLNQKYLEENEKLYDQFMTDMKDLKEKGVEGHLGIDSGYVVKTDNERLLSIGRYVVNTVGSSSTKFMYDTIDKKNQVLITLPSLFKDDSYIEIISETIKNQMIEQMKSDSEKTYWVAGAYQGSIDTFDKISKDQNFYINDTGKLVISFDKYEVAPGYMGVVEFVIPTEVLSRILVSNEYIK